jgi:hypothetical protein
VIWEFIKYLSVDHDLSVIYLRLGAIHPGPYVLRAQKKKEIKMSTNEVRSSEAMASASVTNLDMKLEVVVIPVSNVDRATQASD